MSFFAELLKTLKQSQFADQRGNYDIYRFGPNRLGAIIDGTRRVIKSVIRPFGLALGRFSNNVSDTALLRWAPVLDDLPWVHENLADDDSRELLVRLVAFHLLGPRAIRLPLSNPEYWKRIKELESLGDPSNTVPCHFMNWQLARFDLSPIGFPVRLYENAMGVMLIFVLEQYCPAAYGPQVRPGDVVIDGGGCYGDTAHYFACKAGPTGSVFSFEFVPKNLDVFKKNLELNPEIAQRIDVNQFALWEESDRQLFVYERGPGTVVSFTPPGDNARQVAVSSITIDDFVDRRGLSKIDFIKMDIEGSEYNALRGALRTIRRFRPKLALCVYHSPNDFVRLMRTIDDLKMGYRFRLGHFTIHQEETVLFAEV